MKTIDLNGKWELRWCDGERGPQNPKAIEVALDRKRAIEANVPGSVHNDLVRAGIIAEPTEGLNVLHCRWVEERYWYYRRTLRVQALRKGQRAYLVFDGLDLGAVVYVNGKEVGSHANAYYPCRLDVTDALSKGENVLLVRLDSGIFHGMDRSADGYNVNPSSRLTKRPWMRKPQFSSGWDWSPRLLNVGIHGPARLVIADSVRYDQTAVSSEVSDDLDTGTVTARMHVEGVAEKPVDGVLTLTVAGAGKPVRMSVKITKGANRLEAKAVVAHPRLWWPVGHGPQNRYTVTVSLSVAGRAVATEVRKIGFRRVRVNQDPHPAGGRYFVIEVNGKPIFCKGGNFVPADIVLSRIGRSRYETLVDRALEANCNFLRVWGGGLYEHDDFYEACDRRGLLVWQEFIFACAKYPTTDEKFLADVKREAEYQIRRLAHRPSLVIWCGNNEMEWGNYNWGYERGVAHPDYALFHMVLPRLLKENDGTRYYQPSSPFSPDHDLPNKDEVGDQHPWSIGFGNTDFREYRKMACRFPNEGGILGPTARPSVLKCLPAGQRRLGSLAWETHDNSVSYWTGYQPDKMLDQWLGLDAGRLSVTDYVYWGGLLQGEGLSEYIKNFRRRMFSTSSAIFWMYNDCWPAVRSWTIVDYDLLRTPSFHPVRRAFAPVTVVVAREDGAVRVFGVNEGPEVEATLRFGVMALAGRYPSDQTRSVRLPANASTVLAEFPAARWERLGERTHVAFAVLHGPDGNEIARDRLFMPLYKEMQWPAAKVSVAVKGGKAIFRSSAFAWRVCLDLDGVRSLPDNFFDVYPGVPTVLDWPARLGMPKILRVGNL
jgi:beta-mannosidase